MIFKNLESSDILISSFEVNKTFTVTNEDTEITAGAEKESAIVLDAGTTLSDIVDAINEVGASAADMVAILEALREAGSLRAELIII